MAGKTCWKCPCCSIYQDAFDTNIDGWTVDAGTASHATDHMELTAAGTLVTSTATDDGTVYLSSILRCGDSNKVFWVLVDYLDDENYHALKIEFRYSGDATRIQLYEVAAGTPTALGSAVETMAGAHVAEGDPMLVQVCLTLSGLLIGTIQGAGVTTFATITRHEGDRVGYLLESAAATLEVDNVDWQTDRSERDTCPTCGVYCSGCVGEMEVTISGVADDGGCNNCNELLNRTFILPQICSCVWLLELGEPDGCGNGPSDTTHAFCSVPPEPELPISRPFLLLTVNFFFGVTIDLSYVDNNNNVAQWQYSDDPGTEECVARLSQTLPIGANGTGCNIAGSTATTDFIAA